MKYTSTLLMFVLLAFLMSARADTYGDYQTTRYFSADRRYFVEVNEKKRATLYSNAKKLKPIWTRGLPDLPDDLIISDDGSRVAVIDRYYGNGGNPAAIVVLILDGRGNDLASYSLGEVANLQRVLHTTSSSHWYLGARFTADAQLLIIETFVKKCNGPSLIRLEADAVLANDCDKAMPYERLRFSALTGKMLDRSLLASVSPH